MSSSLRFVILLLCLALSGQVFADDADWQGKPLRDFVASIAQVNIRVIFSSDVLLDEYLVLEEPAAEDPLDALREALSPYGLRLTPGPGGSHIVVRDDSAGGSIFVAVIDSGSSLPVERARVMLDGRLAGHTDARGELRMAAIRPGNHEIAVAATGYASPAAQSRFVSAVRRAEISLSLAPLVTPLPEIVVTSSSYVLRYADPATHTFLDRELTTRLPDVGDEAVRSVDRLPGTANGGVSTRTHVRGGIDNEVLLLFDGVRLYEPYHLKDFHNLSTIIDQNAIAGIDFYGAGYQARYGDRMSGVIDIGMRDPPTETITELGLSFFSASLLSVGTFGDEVRGDWLLSARRGNLDLVADIADSGYGAPRYQDWLIHLGWRLNERSYLSANALLSYDKVSLAELDQTEQAGARYWNRNLWLKLQTDWNSKLATTSIVSAVKIDNTRTGQTDRTGVVSGSLDDDRTFTSIGFRQTLEFNASDDWFINAGFDLKRHEASYAHQSTLTISPPFDQIFQNQPFLSRDIRSEPGGAQYAVFLESRWRLTDALIVDAGLRWDQQTYTIANNDDQTSPRINLLYRLGEQTELRFGFGHFYQAQEINELQISDGVAVFFPAQRAQHAVASLTHQFANDTELRIEWYEKKYRSLAPRFENAFDPLALIPELQIDRVRIDAAGAVTRGAELMLSREGAQNGGFWWLSYGWAEISDATASGEVRRSWDQTHTVKAGINWDWMEWNFSAAGLLHTGWPKSTLTVETVTNPDGSSSLVASTPPRNSLRYSVFHTVDVRISRDFDLKRGSLTAFLELTNVYNRKNPCCTEYSMTTDLNANQVLVADEDNWLPLLPSLGVLWRF